MNFSRRKRELDELGNRYREAFSSDLPVEDLGVGLAAKRVFDVGFAAFFAEKGDTAAAAGTTDFCRDRTVCVSDVDQMVHMRSCDVGRKPFSLRIAELENITRAAPITGDQRTAKS